MTETVHVVPDADAMRDLGVRLGQGFQRGDLVVLSGPLGAGKTTLTQGIAKGLQVDGPVTSPTFVIARVHPSSVGGPDLIHVDAYRLTSLAEVDDLDLDVSLTDSVTVVEWGEDKVTALHQHPVVIRIDRTRETRQVSVSSPLRS